ncbi:unnamed protein product [Phytophthora lilii]|uniref:Unnamed protein product n=1 Tax=Phytophthora lilii TaxID=2077276 RepID=A0A9W7D8A8_9STRA|nr:unnamed protein product [Phytophthora lilii]
MSPSSKPSSSSNSPSSPTTKSRHCRRPSPSPEPHKCSLGRAYFLVKHGQPQWYLSTCSRFRYGRRPCSVERLRALDFVTPFLHLKGLTKGLISDIGDYKATRLKGKARDLKSSVSQARGNNQEEIDGVPNPGGVEIRSRGLFESI